MFWKKKKWAYTWRAAPRFDEVLFKGRTDWFDSGDASTVSIRAELLGSLPETVIRIGSRINRMEVKWTHQVILVGKYIKFPISKIVPNTFIIPKGRNEFSEIQNEVNYTLESLSHNFCQLS